MVLAAPYGAPIVVRIAGGVKLPPLDIRLIWPCQDGHVTIAFLFGTSIGPFTARLMEWVHDEGFCDDATLAKDWIGFAVKIDEGNETVEEFERVKACVAGLPADEDQGRAARGGPRPQAADRPDHHDRRRGRLAAAGRPGLLAGAGRARRGVRARPRRSRFPGDDRRATRRRAASHAAGPRRPPSGQHTEEVLAEARPLPGRARRHHAGRCPGELPLAGLKVLDFMWAMAGPGAHPGAGRLRGHRGAGRVAAQAGGGPRPPALRRRRGRLGDRRAVHEHEHRQARPGARPGQARVPATSSSTSSAGPTWSASRSRPRPCGAGGWATTTLREVNPERDHAVELPDGPDRPAGACSPGSATWPPPSPASTTSPAGPTGRRRGRSPPTPTTSRPASRWPVLMAALDHRRRTGEGQHIDFSQAEASLHLLGPALLDYTRNGRVLGRHGNRDPLLGAARRLPVPGRRPLGGDRRRRDDTWRALCAEAGFGPELAGLSTAERLARADELDELLAGVDRRRSTRDDVERRLQARGVPAHGVHNSPESWRRPPAGAPGPLRHHRPRPARPGRRWRAPAGSSPGRRRPRTGPRRRSARTRFEILTDLLGYDVDRVADLAAAELLE